MKPKAIFYHVVLHVYKKIAYCFLFYSNVSQVVDYKCYKTLTSLNCVPTKTHFCKYFHPTHGDYLHA